MQPATSNLSFICHYSLQASSGYGPPWLVLSIRPSHVSVSQFMVSEAVFSRRRLESMHVRSSRTKFATVESLGDHRF